MSDYISTELQRHHNLLCAQYFHMPTILALALTYGIVYCIV